MRWPGRQTVGYVAVLGVCFVLAMAAGWTTFGIQIDNDAYDFLFRLDPAVDVAPESIVLGVDEQTLMSMGGLRRLRAIVASGITMVDAARPKVVAVDLILADPGDPSQDAALEAAFRKSPKLVLASDLIRSGWEDPLPRFRRLAAAVGHVHAAPDPYDNVTRRIPLEKAAGEDRRWALSLEAFRLAHGIRYITETPTSLEVGSLTIPASRSDARSLYLRFLRPPKGAAFSIPEISIAELAAHPGLAKQFHGKVVFVGVTAQSATADRHMTPYSAGEPLPGVVVHATAFETLARGNLLRTASNSSVLLFCLALAVTAGLAFAWWPDWRAYAAGVGVIGVAQVTPYLLFRSSIVFPYAPPVSAAWLGVVGAAGYQHFVVRRLLRKSESARSRYQQAIHFVTHEMRTPLTAIQGSSELMGRYRLGEEKSKQLAHMINTESKRLARMIQTFLNVERLTAGEMELKREPFEISTIIEACLERVRPLAERKRIDLRVGASTGTSLVGDRELMEYAVYNLLNNAVKYSPAGTEIEVFSQQKGGELRFSVKDQGIGMDAKELKNIFKKFYRTRKAESSGAAGTGIGLSIVEQIVTQHGGRMEVTSRPGAGSCFTIVLPAPVSATAAEGN